MTNSSSPYITSREFLDMAIEFEKDAVRFYSALEKQSTPGAVSQLLSMLKKEEAQHVVALQQWSLAEPNAMMQFPPDLIGKMPEAPDGPISLSELIEVAIERERIAKEAYLAAARSVTGDFRKMIEAFATFEEEHEEKLRSMRGI
jgi:rubrerythrin